MDPTVDDLIARLRRNPEDAEAFAALKGHYHRQGAFDQLAKLLEVRAARTRDRAASAAAYHEAAEIAERRLGDARRAIALLERAIDRDPSHRDAAAALEQILEAAGDSERLVEVLERRAAALGARKGDPLERAELHHRLGQLWEASGQRTERALFHYRKAFDLDPDNQAAIYAARELYRTANNHRATAELYELEIPKEQDSERKTILLRELAAVRADGLHDFDGAVEALELALTLAPEDLHVMHELSTALLLRIEQGGHDRELAPLKARAAAVLYAMASVVPPDHAIPYCEAALDSVPDHEGALELLERLVEEHGGEDRLPIRWIRYLEMTPDGPTAAARRLCLGRAYVHVGQLEDAVSCLEPLLELGHAEAAEALVELYPKIGRTDALPDALSVLIASLPPQARLDRLHELVEVLRETNRRDEAANRAREILAITPGDLHAHEVIEEFLREAGDPAALFTALAGAADNAHLPADARRRRYVEAARIAETELDRLDEAISLYRALGALDPEDEDAPGELARLLELSGRWDELVVELESQAERGLSRALEAERHRKLAEIHLHRRNDLERGIEALYRLHALVPEDEAARDALIGALIEANRHAEAVPLLEERIDATSGADRMDQLRLLASILEERIGDHESAFSAWSRILDEDPEDFEALDRMERIDTAYARYGRLLETLIRRTDVTAPNERTPLYRRMGQLADQHLGDLDGAAGFYERALEANPRDAEILDALSGVYERANRFEDLVEKLRDRAELETDIRTRAEIYRRIGRIAGDRLDDTDAASAAWKKVLEAGEDEEALRWLRDLAEKHGHSEERADYLRRLSEVVPEAGEKIELRFERAVVFANELARPDEARSALREVLDTLDARHEPSLERLVQLSEAPGEEVSLADALERTLAATEDEADRVPIASRLADLYEEHLDDPKGAIRALRAWADADLTDTAPRRRLATLLERAECWSELIDVYDELAGVEQEDAAAGEATRKAAELALGRLSDVDGAFRRLVERVEEGDPLAEADLRKIADEHQRGEALADLYVALAKKSNEPEAQRQRWVDAAKTLEDSVGDAARALEAMLRAFATALDDNQLLGEVDRLASTAGAWPRLAQVYDSLVRRAEGDEEKVELLLRHAELLDRHANDRSQAFDRLLQATALVPDDDEILARSEELAETADRRADLLPVYERRAQHSSDQNRFDALLRATRLSQWVIGDGARAAEFLAHAAVTAAQAPGLLDHLEESVSRIDRDHPEGATEDARRALIETYRRLSNQLGSQASGAELLLRAARLTAKELSELEAAFELLGEAASKAPGDAKVLDELEAFAREQKRLDRLEGLLGALIEEALESATAVELLRRRARLLEEDLARLEDAAEAYRQLETLEPEAFDVRERLRSCLQKAGRHQDVLLVLDRDLERTRDPERRIELLREIARIWERDLKNRWEAIDAWKTVAAEAPADPEAKEALGRLDEGARRLVEDDDVSMEVAEARDETEL